VIFCKKKFRYDPDIPSTATRNKKMVIYHHIKLSIFWVHPPSGGGGVGHDFVELGVAMAVRTGVADG